MPVVAVLGQHDKEVPPEATEELVETFVRPLLVRCSTPGHKVHKLGTTRLRDWARWSFGSARRPKVAFVVLRAIHVGRLCADDAQTNVVRSFLMNAAKAPAASL